MRNTAVKGGILLSPCAAIRSSHHSSRENILFYLCLLTGAEHWEKKEKKNTWCCQHIFFFPPMYLHWNAQGIQCTTQIHSWVFTSTDVVINFNSICKHHVILGLILTCLWQLNTDIFYLFNSILSDVCLNADNCIFWFRK